MKASFFIVLAIGLVTGNARAQPVEQPAEPDSPEEPALADPEAPVVGPAPAAVAGPAAPLEPRAGYAKGFFIHGEDEDVFSLKINGRVQARLELESADAIDGRDEDAAFSVPRARIKMSGHAHSEAIKYSLQADFGKGFVTLKDFYVDYDRGPARLRVGQWKRPFSRQQITSSGSLELVDRAITDKFFGGGRDIGLALHNGYDKAPEGLGWVVGVFNGTGDKPRFSGTAVVTDPLTGDVDIVSGGFSNVPDTFAPAVVARADLNRGGIKGFSEADLEGGPLRWSVGGSVLAELDADDDDDSSIRAQLDYIAKLRGFSTTGGLYVATAQDDTSFFDQSHAAVGAHLQAGYVIDDTYQPAVRYALIVPEDGDELHELLVGFSIYAFSHSFKWQTDVGVSSTGSFAVDQVVQLRTQLQLAF